jgi:type IV pilus biogenesis protein CpaD/CtpE
MQIKKILLSCAAMLSLASCGGSSSSTAPTIPNQDDSQVIAPIVVEDISCSVNYPLAISSIVTENDNTNIAMLFNGVKLNALH